MGFLALPGDCGWRPAGLGERRRPLALGRRQRHRREPLLQARAPGRHPHRRHGRAHDLRPRRALAFVDRRIADVMAFEKWKATTRLRPGHWLEQAAERLGRARYGS
jgi:hypothetical protein